MMANFNTPKNASDTLDGMKFNYLTVLHRVGSNKHGKRTWMCLCECGKTTVQTTGDLRSGKNISCGCANNERARMLKFSHGEAAINSKTTEYQTWLGMIKRCSNKNEKCWIYYGGRGISVCERWMRFDNFLADMGRRPSKSHSIDRVDVNGDYCPENCKWSTKLEQSRNTRSNVFITIDGVTKCLAEWSEITGVWDSTFRSRVRAGIPPEIAITHKGRIDRRTMNYGGEK